MWAIRRQVVCQQGPAPEAPAGFYCARVKASARAGTRRVVRMRRHRARPVCADSVPAAARGMACNRSWLADLHGQVPAAHLWGLAEHISRATDCDSVAEAKPWGQHQQRWLVPAAEDLATTYMLRVSGLLVNPDEGPAVVPNGRTRYVARHTRPTRNRGFGAPT